jgi:hypothetical protein
LAGVALACGTAQADVVSGSEAVSGSNSTSNSQAISKGGSANQGQDQGQSQGQQQKSSAVSVQGQDASNKNIINFGNAPEHTTATITTDNHYSGTQSIKSAPPLGLGNLAPTTPCSNTYQLGVSGMGFGVGAGGVVIDGDCTRREYARILWAAGAQQAAIGMLCQNEELQKVAPVMCRKAKDELGAGTFPNQDLPAYPSTKPVPPPVAQPKMSEAPAPVAPVAAAPAVKPSNVPATGGAQQGDIVVGNDGSKYRLVGQAWVKIVNERQPLVPPVDWKEAKLSLNEYDGRNVGTFAQRSTE